MSNNNFLNFEGLTTFFNNLLNKFALKIHKHTLSDITDYKVDTELSSTSTNPVANKTVNTGFSIVGNSISSLQTAVSGKADTNHNHDDKYYTESEIDSKLDTKSDKSHNHDSAYETKTDAQSKFNSAKSYTTTEINKLSDTVAFIDTTDNESVSGIAYSLTTADIADNLNNSSSSMVLSAKQGKILNDRISNIIVVDESTEGNTELIDIRTGIDGTKYPTAGDAVREQIGQLSSDIDDLSKSYNLVSKNNLYHIFRIGGSSINNAVLKKDSENPYYCVLIDASVNKTFTISHSDTGLENGYRQFKAVAVDVNIADMLAWGENKGISTDHIQWIFAETGEYAQTKNVTISDNMKTLVVQFSKDILPEYMEILVGTFETQQFANYREGIIPIGYVYSKTEADEKFLNKTEADEYTKMKQTYALSNGRLTVCVGKSKFWIERRNDSDINLDTWLIQRMYINDVVVMAGTDIEGPIKQVGASDFTGGIHGDEKFSTVKVLVDGNIIDLSATILEKTFKQLDIFVESAIYFCNTSNTAFTRCKHICFRRGKTIISNSIKYVGTDDYSVYRWPASGIFSIYKDLMTGYVTNTDCEYITNKGKENDVDFDEITFFGENYAVKIKNTGKKYSSYVGFVQDFSGESRPRFKVYFDTLDDYKGDVILKTNDKVFASYEIEVN